MVTKEAVLEYCKNEITTNKLFSQVIPSHKYLGTTSSGLLN